MARVTLNDVAVRAGVSMKTVSNVVRGYRHVSPAMRAKVQAVIDELGYRPNLSGRSLATGRSNMLALALPDLRRPYFAELAHAFAGVAAERGYRLILEETSGTADGELAVFRDREAGIVDGVIFYPAGPSTRELDALLGNAPTVFLGEQPVDDDRVAIDNVAAADEATTHLIRLGRRRIGFYGHAADDLSSTDELRLEGYRRALERAGYPYDDALLVGRSPREEPWSEGPLGAALDAGLEVDALLCRDDLAALGAMRAIRLRNLSVPGDVAIIGWDAVEIGAAVVPSLTSVAPDTREVIERALDLLMERIGGSTQPARLVTVGHRLLLRESAPALEA